MHKKNIKLLILDVDGTLTDGKIYFSPQGECAKAFHVKDGLGIRNILPSAGISTAIITGRTSEIVTRRCEELGITHIYQGISDKLWQMKRLLQTCELTLNQCAYMGDDINDLECIRSAAVSGCPADACDDVKQEADFITRHKGGDGAVREFIDWLCAENQSEI